MHNSYETCTTSMELAQLLWNVRNSYETCATSMIYLSSQTLQKALNDTIPIYIYIWKNKIHVPNHQPVSIYIQMIPLNTLDKFDCDSLSSLFWDDQLRLEYPMLKQSLETRHQLHSKAPQKCRKKQHELHLKYWYTKAVILWIFLSTVQKPIGSG